MNNHDQTQRQHGYWVFNSIVLYALLNSLKEQDAIIGTLINIAIIAFIGIALVARAYWI